MNKLAALFLLLLLPSCDTLAPGTAANYMLVYTGDGVEVHSINAQNPSDVRAVGYNHKTKIGYLVYANGETTRLKVIGGGFGGGSFTLILEGGARVNVDVKTGKVTTTGNPLGKQSVEPMPQ